MAGKKKLIKRIEELEAENIRIQAEAAKQISELTAVIEALTQKVAELTEKLNKNSSNSSKPPSSDGLKKKPVNKNRSLREKSGKNPGGQEGHTGSYLAVPKADIIENHMHTDCENCPHRRECLNNSCVKEERNVIDIVVEVSTVSHRAIIVNSCPISGEEKIGEFPENVRASLQYGSNLEALAVALNTIGAVSINRTHDILSGVFNIPISTGTINKMVSRCAQKIKPALENIIQKLLESNKIHCDETGTRAEGRTQWVHCASNELYTYLELHSKRGFAAMNDIGILPKYKGTIIHDCWAPYFRVEGVRHQLCCAHLLRELKNAEENHPEQTWASAFSKLLLKLKRAKERAISQGKEKFSDSTLRRYEKKYYEVLQTAYRENPKPEKSFSKRVRVKKGKILSLVDRLFKYKGEVCLFANDFKIPFDNNLAERDIRVIKVKTKVSGCRPYA